MKNRILETFATPFDPHDARREANGALDLQRVRATAERWITENPGVALGAALTVGVLLGWLVKRK